MEAFIMGDVRVDPDRSSILFSAQMKNGSAVSSTVRVYQIPISGERPPRPAGSAATERGGPRLRRGRKLIC